MGMRGVELSGLDFEYQNRTRPNRRQEGTGGLQEGINMSLLRTDASVNPLIIESSRSSALCLGGVRAVAES